VVIGVTALPALDKLPNKWCKHPALIVLIVVVIIIAGSAAVVTTQRCGVATAALLLPMS